MPHDLNAIYSSQITAMIAADEMSLAVTKDMQDAATHDGLKTGLENAVCGISDGLDIVREIASAHGISASNAGAPGMKALADEARAAALDADFADPRSRDAAILLHFQRFTHFGLTSYAVLARMARALKFDDDAEKLATCHSNAQDGDDDMAEVAGDLLAKLSG